MSQLTALPIYRAVDANGNPMSGAKLYFYQSGTITPAAVYTSSTMTTPHTNPVVADSGGLFPPIYTSPTVTYRAILKTSAGVTIIDLDPISGGAIESVSAEAFGAIGDGTTDNATALRTAVAFALANDIGTLTIGKGWFRCNSNVPIMPTANLSYATGFRMGLRVRGAGTGSTKFDFRGTGSAMFDTAPNHDFLTFKAILGVEFSGFTITTAASPDTTSGAGGIKMRAVFEAENHDVHVIGLSGNAFEVASSQGDRDGSNIVKFRQCRAELCDGWGFTAAATGANNEISYIETDGLIVSECGTAESKAIQSFTAANPGVFTIDDHGFADDTEVRVAGTGKTSIDRARYRLKVLSTSTFKLQTGSTAIGWTDLDTTAAGAGGAAGRVWPAEPSSGGFKWKGQVGRFQNGGAVLCKNVGFYIPGGAGLAQDCILDGFAVENCGLLGVLVTGCRGVQIRAGSHLYQNGAISVAVMGQPSYFGVLFDATNFVVANTKMDLIQVRNTASETNFIAFSVIGGNAFVQDMLFENTIWKADGWAGQERFSSSIRFRHSPQECELYLESATVVRFGPKLQGTKAAGNSTPLRLRVGTAGNVTTGEWVERHTSSAGLSLSNATVDFAGAALANDTTYNAFLYDSGGGTPALVLSTTATAVDTVSGHEVMSGTVTHLFVGRVRTNGAAQFVAVDSHRLPTEYSTTWDPSSVANGAQTSTTLSSGVISAIGDPTKASASLALGGLSLWAEAGTNAMTWYLGNLSGGAVDLASMTVYAKRERR